MANRCTKSAYHQPHTSSAATAAIPTPRQFAPRVRTTDSATGTIANGSTPSRSDIRPSPRNSPNSSDVLRSVRSSEWSHAARTHAAAAVGPSVGSNRWSPSAIPGPASSSATAVSPPTSPPSRRPTTNVPPTSSGSQSTHCAATIASYPPPSTIATTPGSRVPGG